MKEKDMRVFAAIDIEDDTVRNDLRVLQEKLCLGGKRTDPDHFHITLTFFGDVNERRVKEIKKKMRAVRVPATEAVVERIGAFPHTDFIKVVWAGVNDIQPVTAAWKEHFLLEDDFVPHITLCRYKTLAAEKKRVLQSRLEAFNDRTIGTIKVETIRLKKSTLTEDGPVYEDLATVSLA